MPYAYETVERLSKSHDVYIVTNGLLTTQTNRLTESGLNKLVKGVFVSENVGYQKPNIKFYERVFEETGISDKDLTIAVGDSLTTDVKGAVNFGIDACLFAPKGTSGSTAGAKYIISDLRDL